MRIRHEEPDLEGLWNDLSVPAEDLVRRDPLPVTADAQLRAERPELADLELLRISAAELSARAEEAWIRARRRPCAEARQALVAWWLKGSR
jgi:hypothetical protein